MGRMDQIGALSRKGMSLAQVSAALGLSEAQVKGRARKAGIAFSSRVGRADDELVLAMLAARSSGESSPSIARRLGVSPERVRTATDRVVRADRNESGESANAVMPHYNWIRGFA